MAGWGDQTVYRKMRRLSVIAVAGLGLAAAGSAQAAPPLTAPGAAHSAAFVHQPAGGDTGHRVH